MGGKSGGDSEIKQEPWGHQKQPLKDIFALAKQTYRANPSEFFPGQTYAEMTPLQMSGLQNMATYGTQEMPGLAADTTGAYKGMLTAPDVANNPYVQDWVQAANRRLGTDFQEQILPGIQKNAIAAGGLGGSRQGVAEGIAAGKLAQAMGDQTANMYNQAYGMGLDQQARAMALAPQQMGIGMMPGQALYDIGAKYRAEEQLPIDEAIQRHYYGQEAPWNDLSKYYRLIGGNNWGGTTSQPNPQSSPLAGAIGGASLGGGLLSMLPASMAGGPISMALPIGGAILGGLFS